MAPKKRPKINFPKKVTYKGKAYKRVPQRDTTIKKISRKRKMPSVPTYKRA